MDAGWTVIRIPEHDVRTKAALTETVDRLTALIQAASPKKANLDLGDKGVYSAGS